MKQMELRFSGAQLESKTDGQLTVSGYVNKTEQPSEILGSSKRFIEKIAKGAFSRALKTAKDIDFLEQHDTKKILASTRNGSLSLREDSQGLYMEAKIEPTTWGKDAYTLIESRIYQNMSFGFKTVRDSWKSLGNGLSERTIEELELFEVSVVKDPAYSQSTISARGIELVEGIEVPSDVELSNKKTESSVNKQEERKNNMKTVHTYGNFNTKNAKKEEEIRDFNNHLHLATETRGGEGGSNLIKSENGAALIPEAVSDIFVEKLDESSRVFSLARKFPTSHGSVKIPHETATELGAFVGEGKNMVEGQIHLGHVKLDQKRVGAFVTLTQQLVNDSAMNMADYVPNLLAKRTFKAIEHSILRGTKEDEFRGIVPNNEIEQVDLSSTATNEQVMDTLLDMVLNIHPEYLQNSQFIMSRPFYNRIAKLKDAVGHFYVQNGIVNGKPTTTLFGLGVVITSSLESGTTVGETPCILGSMHDGYAVMIKKGAELTQIKDTENALHGSVGFLFDAYLDGAVYNEDAITKLVIK